MTTTMLFAFVTIMCMYVGVKILCSEERNTFYNKRPNEVVDVKKYNRFCGLLTIGFGFVADLTILLMGSQILWLSILGTVLLLVEAFAVTKIYAKVEFKMLKKR